MADSKKELHTPAQQEGMNTASQTRDERLEAFLSSCEDQYAPFTTYSSFILHAVEKALAGNTIFQESLLDGHQNLLTSIGEKLTRKKTEGATLTPTQKILLTTAQIAHENQGKENKSLTGKQKRSLYVHLSELLANEKSDSPLSTFQKALVKNVKKALTGSTDLWGRPDSPFRDSPENSLFFLKKRLSSLEEQNRGNKALINDVKAIHQGFQEAMENLSDIQSHNSDFLEKASLRLDTMNKQADSAQERTDALILQANEIITKLSTGALGNAFIEEIRKRSWRLIATRCIFVILLAVIFLVTFALLLLSWYKAPQNWLTDPTHAIPMALRLFVLEMPLIWLTNVVSRRMHMQERILEEYIHKKNVALTYTAIQANLQNLYGSFDTPQAATALKAFTEGFAMAALRDPCDFYDKQPRTDNPMYRLFDTVKETVTSVKDGK